MVLDDLGMYIEAEALATVGTDLILGHMPASPSLCCALLEYGGDAPLRNQNEGAAHSGVQSGERPRVQLLCRASSYSVGHSLIRSIWTLLDGIVNETINGVGYVRVAALQSPFFLEFDDNKRYLFAVNFTVTKAVS
jgi:hypothetical protein